MRECFGQTGNLFHSKLYWVADCIFLKCGSEIQFFKKNSLPGNAEIFFFFPESYSLGSNLGLKARC